MQVAGSQRPALVWSTSEGSRASPSDTRSRVRVEDADMQPLWSLQVLGNRGLLGSPENVSNGNT